MMTQSRAKPIAMPRSARLPPTYIGFRVHLNMPMVASASVGCDGRTFVPMRWKMRLAPITIPMPTTKAMAPTTSRPKKRTWASRPRGIKKLRTTPTTRTESGISGGKIMTFGVSREVSVMASFVAPGLFQSEELRLLLRANQFGSDSAMADGVKTALAASKGESVPANVDTGANLITKENMDFPRSQELLNAKVK